MTFRNEPPPPDAVLPAMSYSALSGELYAEFLKQAAISGYCFRLFRDAPFDSGKKFILLRHDIDFSPEHAVAMGELEHAHGVCSTYFVLADGQFYNLLDREIIGQLRRLLELGHDIGVHVGSANAYHADFPREVSYRARVLEAVLETPIRLYCQHDPVNTGVIESEPEGLTNVVSLISQYDLLYVSDSGKLWREHTFLTALGERSLCLLAHPHSWLAGVDDYVALIRALEKVETEKLSGRFDAFVRNLARYYQRRRCEGV